MPRTSGSRNPYSAYRFRLQIDGIAVAGFSECRGLEMETEIVEYREGGVNDHVHKFPGRTRQANLVLRRGIADRELNDWYESVRGGVLEPRDGAIQVYDPSPSEVVMEWRFQGGFPCRWQGPDLNAIESRVAVETLEICHDGLSRTI